jgi:hypothetical protein
LIITRRNHPRAVLITVERYQQLLHTSADLRPRDATSRPTAPVAPPVNRRFRPTVSSEV